MRNVREHIKYYLSKAFDIREGEMRRAVLMQFNIFLIISTLLIIKPTVNGLFLAKFGAESLPKAFMLVAVFAGLVSIIYARALIRISLFRIMRVTQQSSVVTLVLFGVFLRINFWESGILYLFYLWVSIFAVLSASQFWVLANMVFNTREAKRLFGFIGAGAIAGGIVGGYLTSLLAPSLGSENLPFIGAFLLSFCIPITANIWKRDAIKAPPPIASIDRKGKKISPNPIKHIARSKHLSLLAGIVGVSVVVAKLVDYQFGDLASTHIPEPDELTAFFGFWFSSFNVISLFLQLFLTRRVLGTLGVGTSLFFLPGSIFLAAVVLVFIPELWVAVILKMADGSLKQSINKAAVELLILPIPQDIKNQTKTFIDVFIDSLATGLSGLILIFVISGLELSTLTISLIIIFLTLLWAWLALKVQREYIRTFKRRIDHFSESDLKALTDLEQESIIESQTKILTSGTKQEILPILKQIREERNDRFFEKACELLEHPSSEVKAAAIHYLYFFKKKSIPESIEPLIQDPSQQVKIKAFEYLIEHQAFKRLDLIKHYLQVEDLYIHGAAMVALALESRNKSGLIRKFKLDQRLQTNLQVLSSIENEEQLCFVKITILKTIAYSQLVKFYPIINEYLKDTNPAVVEQAILSAGLTKNLVFIDSVIKFLPDPTYGEIAGTALRYFGPAAIEPLAKLLNQTETDLSLLRIIPATVKKIGTQKSVDFLFRIFDHPDKVVRFEVLRALNYLHTHFPQLKFQRKQVLKNILAEARLYSDTLAILHVQNHKNHFGSQPSDQPDALTQGRQDLIKLLERRLDRNLERIFRLLGLKYPPEDIYKIYKSLRSKQAEMRYDALEFLDNLLEPNLKKVLIPLVETAMMDTFSEKAIRHLKLKIPGEYECFERLLSGRDVPIAMAVLTIIRQLEDTRYIPLLRKGLQSTQQQISLYSRDTLQMLEAYP